MNNFKELQKIQEEQYKLNLNKIQNQMDSNIGLIGVFSQVIEMYLSKVVDCMLNLAGANSEEKETTK
jgi:hypothetical protein